MAAVPVSDVAYVMTRNSIASCYLPHDLLYGPYHASLLRLQGHLHSSIPTVYVLTIWNLRNSVVW